MIDNSKPGIVRLDYGPMQMTISAEDDWGPMPQRARDAAQHAMEILSELASYKVIAASPQQELPASENWPAVLRQMIDAVTGSGDRTLTPMAAVAGSIADLTADWLHARGATKVLVNNGGDIAVRLTGSQTTTVGVAPAIGHNPTHALVLAADNNIGGIATSGLGGRSFTKGIASAAVVAAARASLADACATSLGNATYIDHPAVKVKLAEQLDPNTDIRGHKVVEEVGLLPTHVVEQALHNSWTQAVQLYKTGLIKGAAIFVQQRVVMIPENFITEI
ncbi:MAG: hypothetical protein H6Q72_3012 [Firmicutes bacterium]|nr:hypothetical protein [Bacillota bacterium]